MSRGSAQQPIIYLPDSEPKVSIERDDLVVLGAHPRWGAEGIGQLASDAIEVCGKRYVQLLVQFIVVCALVVGKLVDPQLLEAVVGAFEKLASKFSR